MVQKIPEKSGFREKSGLNIFPDFFWNGFFALFCDNKVFLDFQNINFNGPLWALKNPHEIGLHLRATDPWISKTDNERNAREARMSASN